VSPDELAVGTLKKMNDICIMLSAKKNKLRSTLPTTSVTILGQTKESPLDLCYNICQKMGISLPEEFSSYEDTLQILQKMDHPYIDEPERFMEDLNSLVGKIFDDIKLIIVDDKKGYMIIEDTKNIEFYRITRGHPRFKVIF
jgi:hypothetical protein